MLYCYLLVWVQGGNFALYIFIMTSVSYVQYFVLFWLWIVVDFGEALRIKSCEYIGQPGIVEFMIPKLSLHLQQITWFFKLNQSENHNKTK